MKTLRAPWLRVSGFLLLMAWGVLHGLGYDYILYVIHPSGDFDAAAAGDEPDYADDRYWAALPSKPSGAQLSPAGDALPDGPRDADVFYVHPTSYIRAESWNSPLFVPTRAWEMIDIILGAQASAFNDCCRVYAPHYRQAALSSFIEPDSDNARRALELAYSDVRDAFDEFLARIGDRPFVIASHSQGTYHALRLLSERIDGRPPRSRLVTAYLIGYWLPLDTFERTLQQIGPCEAADDLACVVHWSTYGASGERRAGVPHWYPDGHELSDNKPLLCINPLSWQRDGARVEAEEHSGALYVSRGGSRLHTFLNRPVPHKLQNLPDLLPDFTWAECRDGLLRVASQDETVFAEVGTDDSQDYHMIDYSLFYEPLRRNALERVRHYHAGNQWASLRRPED